MSMLSTAQELILKGRVVNEHNQAVEFANVIVRDSLSSGIAGFAITDELGEFKIALKTEVAYSITVSFVGYEKYIRQYTFDSEETISVLIKLKESSTLLNEVQVVEEMPVVMSGDTLVYKTESFVNGREQKLEDVLNKLPGVEVDKDGGVTVQGKKVSKLLVEGKQFFDGDTKMGVKNIPANAIDKVQVLNNYNEIGPLNSVNNSEQIALNIKLKEGKKNMVFGDVEAGGGPSSRYLGHLNGFYYSKKLNANLIADANNIGEQAFSQRDYYRFGGSMQESLSNGTQLNTDQSANMPSLVDKFSAYDLNNSLIATNLNYQPNSKVYHTGFLIGARSAFKALSKNQRRFIGGDVELNELLISDRESDQLSGFAKYAIQWSPSTKSFFKYGLFAKANQNTQLSKLDSYSQDTLNMRAYEEGNNYSFTQRLEAYHSISDKHIVSGYADVTIGRITPDYTLNSQAPVLNYLDLNKDSLVRIRQYSTQDRVLLNLRTDYYWVLNRLTHLNFVLGSTNEQLGFKSDLDQLYPEQEKEALLADSLSNDVERTINDLYTGLGLKTKWKDFVVFPQLYYHHYGVVLEGEEQSMQYWLPKLVLSYQISSPQKLSFQYARTVNFQGVDHYASGIRLSNYFGFDQGNRQLKEGLTDQYSLNYNYFNLFSGLNIFSQVQYSEVKNGLGQSISSEGLVQGYRSINLPDKNYLLSAYFNINKNFKKFKAGMSYTLDYLNGQLLFNELAIRNKRVNTKANVNIGTTFFKKLECNLSNELSYNLYQDNVFITQSPTIKLDWAIADHMNLQTSLQHNQYKAVSTGNENAYQNWDVQYNYSPVGKPWQIQLIALNLLNNRSIRTDGINNNIISTQEIYIQPSYFLANFKYNF